MTHATHLEGSMGALDGPIGQVGRDAGQRAAGVILSGEQRRRSGLGCRLRLRLLGRVGRLMIDSRSRSRSRS